MARYEDFIGAVRERLAGTDVERAREAVARTFGGLVRWLPREERSAVRDALPAPLRPAGIEDSGTAGGDAATFIGFVAGREGRAPERVRYEVQAVLSAFEAVEPDVARRLRRSLPEDFGGLFSAPGGGPPVDLAAGSGVPPAELTDEDVQALLRRLPQWNGDRRRLSRPLAPPDYVAEQLFARIRELERALGHRAVVVTEPDGTYRIDVWTHSEDLVTNLDASFAMAVEDLIDDVLLQRRPGPSPAPERQLSPPRPPAEPVPGTSQRRDRDRDGND